MSAISYIIDRIENGIAVLESQDEMLEIPKSMLPKDAKEGHVLIKNGDSYTIDHDLTKKRRDNIKSRLEKLLGRSVE